MGFNKKVLSKAVSELDKAKAPAKPRDIITDPAGQWKYPGQKTRIPGSSITMQGVNYPVWAQPNVGPGSMMQPNQDYNFPDADYVDETPIGKKGGTLKSKRYSSNISATNKLFTKNKLFQSKKHKIFDPNAKFKSGGSKLGPINLNPNPLSHYELNYGYNLPTEQDGGVHGNPWLYTNMQENEGRDPGQIIGLGANFQHKSGLHGDANVELPFFNKDAIRNSSTELGYTKRHKNFVADATLQNSANPYKQFDPSLNIGVGYNKNLGEHVGFGIEASNKMIPGKLWNPGVHVGMTYNFQEGGENDDTEYEDLELTDEEIQAYRDGGYVVEELPEAQDGGPQNTSGPRAEEIPTDVDAMNAMMKARMATDAEFGNPAAQRMTSPNPKTYDFGNGDLGTHFMASMGNQAVPLLQDKGGDELEYNENPPPSKEDMNFRNPEEAQYFAEHYKEVAPMMKGFKKGGYVQHELVKAQTGLTKKPLKISDPDEYAFRKAAYDDSSTMHRLYDNDYNAVKKFKTINEINNYRNSQIKSKGKQENAASMRLGNPNPEKVETHTNLDGEYTTTTYKKPVQPVQFVPNIKSTSKKGVWSGGSEEQYPTGINTSDFERKTREYQQQQRVNKPIAQMRKQGGAITEAWKDELDDHTIKLLRKAGYIVEELD